MAKAPAPLGLRPEEVGQLVTELEPAIVGARVDKVVDHGPGPSGEAFVIRLSRVRERLSLLVTVREGYTRFHLIPDAEAAPDRPTDKAMALRELLRGGKVESIDQPQGDRILRIELTFPRGEKTIRRALVQELFGNQGRLVVIDSHRRTVLWATGRGGTETLIDYRFPPPPPKRPVDSATLPFDPKRLISESEIGSPFAFHLALARHMDRAERVGDFETRRERLARRIRDELKRQRRLLENLGDDLEEAERWEQYERRGELLKSEIHRLHRGDTEVELTDYYDPALPKIRIALDATRTPAENVERLFRRARKGKRAHAQVAERREACESAIARLEEARDQVAAADFDGDSDLEGIEIRLGRVLPRERRKQSRPTAPTDAKEKQKGPRRFRSRQGFEILAGRSGKENDRLTMSVARGNDLFFHRAHRPGPHVILRVPPGKVAAPESLEDAAFLAAYLGGWRGPAAAMVHWCPRKYIRKPKGLPPGKVLVDRPREFLVAYQPELLARLSLGDG